jgi:nucleotide-binding universal stress UspA family protein
MYNNIVVAVDESEMAILALNEAINLAHALQSKLIIINVVEMSLPPSTDIAYVAIDFDKYLESVKKNGDELLEKVRIIAQNVGVNASTKLVENTHYGRISDKILESAYALSADLLVLGTHGRRGFHRFFIGSVAEEVIRTSNLPILLIRGSE